VSFGCDVRPRLREEGRVAADEPAQAPYSYYLLSSKTLSDPCSGEVFGNSYSPPGNLISSSGFRVGPQ